MSERARAVARTDELWTADWVGFWVIGGVTLANAADGHFCIF